MSNSDYFGYRHSFPIISLCIKTPSYWIITAVCAKYFRQFRLRQSLFHLFSDKLLLHWGFCIAWKVDLRQRIQKQLICICIDKHFEKHLYIQSCASKILKPNQLSFISTMKNFQKVILLHSSLAFFHFLYFCRDTINPKVAYSKFDGTNVLSFCSVLRKKK